ncbi:EpsG family protein [Fibrobacter sp. HC4]|uniref:EpsG family protein n=1 Tax=Fibrobacter sp. HC4 TaxID=3239812 RepID=UPI00201989D5|nr:EpsG family protein [Fibrobacter succinogenes]MCQ2100821.1 EpsG family protein [Fibrobacter sp.]
MKISFVVLIFVGVVRSTDVGGDLWHYLRAYDFFGDRSWTYLFTHRSKYGYIFAALIKTAHSINPSPQSLLAATNILTLIPVYIFIKKYSNNYLMSLFLYISFGFYTNTFNSVRASLALGIGLFMMSFVVERRWRMFFLCLIAAVEIHVSFLVFAVLYPMYKKKITLKYICLTIGVSFILSRMASLWGRLSAMASSYDAGAYSNLDQSTGGFTLLFLMVAITVAFFMINKKHLEKQIQLFMHCMIISCCVLAFATCFTVLTRVAIFFYISMIVLFPLTIKNMKNVDLRRFGSLAVYLLFFVYFALFVMQPLKEYDGSNNQRTLPYTTFWEKNGSV